MLTVYIIVLSVVKGVPGISIGGGGGGGVLRKFSSPDNYWKYTVLY